MKIKVFCCLPIPVESGLSVLVNGHFVLDYETRRNLWSNQSDTVERLWNNTILTSCILPCFITYLCNFALDLLKSFGKMTDKDIDFKIESFYKHFPDALVDRKDYWNLFG